MSERPKFLDFSAVDLGRTKATADVVPQAGGAFNISDELNFDTTNLGYQPNSMKTSIGGEMDLLNKGLEIDQAYAQEAAAAANKPGFFGQKMGKTSDMTVGAHMGLSAAQAALSVVGGLANTRAAEQDALSQMQDEFDLRFGSEEFNAQRLERHQENQQQAELMAMIEEMEQEERANASQTLSNQQQTFGRNA